MKTVTQKARLRQAIIEYIAEEPWAEELLLQEHHEAPSTEHTVPSNQTHSGQPTQKPVPESSQEPTLPKPIDTSKPNDTVQPFDPSDNGLYGFEIRNAGLFRPLEGQFNSAAQPDVRQAEVAFPLPGRSKNLASVIQREVAQQV